MQRLKLLYCAYVLQMRMLRTARLASHSWVLHKLLKKSRRCTRSKEPRYVRACVRACVRMYVCVPSHSHAITGIQALVNVAVAIEIVTVANVVSLLQSWLLLVSCPIAQECLLLLLLLVSCCSHNSDQGVLWVFRLRRVSSVAYLQRCSCQ